MFLLIQRRVPHASFVSVGIFGPWSSTCVLGISCATNMAAGILDQPLTHAEVIETGERVKGQFVALLRAVIPHVAAEVA